MQSTADSWALEADSKYGVIRNYWLATGKFQKHCYGKGLKNFETGI